MTDLHPAAKPEHVRQVLDNLKALERRLLWDDAARQGAGDPTTGDAHLVGKAIIVIESLGSELDKRLHTAAMEQAWNRRYLESDAIARRIMKAIAADCGWSWQPPDMRGLAADSVSSDEDPDQAWNDYKDGYTDIDGNVNEPPDVEP